MGEILSSRYYYYNSSFIIIIFLNVVPFLFEGASFDVVNDIRADKMVTFNYGYTDKP